MVKGDDEILGGVGRSVHTSYFIFMRKDAGFEAFVQMLASFEKVRRQQQLRTSETMQLCEIRRIPLATSAIDPGKSC